MVNYSNDDHPSSVWTLKHAGYETSQPHFFIELPNGEIKPRLAFQRQNPQTSSKLCAIGSDPNRGNLKWTIEQVKK